MKHSFPRLINIAQLSEGHRVPFSLLKQNDIHHTFENHTELLEFLIICDILRLV